MLLFCQMAAASMTTNTHGAHGVILDAAVHPAHDNVGASQAVLPIVVALVTLLMLVSERRLPDALYACITGASSEAASLRHDAPGAGGEELRRRQDASSKEVDRLRIGAWASFFLMIIDVAGGIATNSMALVAESLHLFSDSSSFVMSIWAIKLMGRKATPQFSYGLQQAGALGTLLSMLTVWAMAGILSMEALHRLLHPEPVNGAAMTLVASAGLLSNVLLMLLLGHQHADLGSLLQGGRDSSDGDCCCAPSSISRPLAQDAQRDAQIGRKLTSAKFCESYAVAPNCVPGSQSGGQDHGADRGSLAMRAAVIHVIGDIVQSAGAVLAGVLIWWQPLDLGTTEAGFSRWCYVDASITLLYAGLCLLTTRSTVKEALDALMLQPPGHIDVVALVRQLNSVAGVLSVHNAHVWRVGQSGVVAAHVVVRPAASSAAILTRCADIVQESFGIDHATFQLETPEAARSAGCPMFDA